MAVIRETDGDFNFAIAKKKGLLNYRVTGNGENRVANAVRHRMIASAFFGKI